MYSVSKMSSDAGITIEEFIRACRKVCEVSDRIGDGWKFVNEVDKVKCHIKKNSYLTHNASGSTVPLKVNYVVFYNLSYGVPSFSFNIWNSSGVLLTLEEIRQLSFININKKDFYSVITQQEHPVLSRPYFVMHPCHTATMLADFKSVSKNIIVTFLGLITPLLKINLHLEYGL